MIIMKIRRVNFPFIKKDPIMDAHRKLLHWEAQKHRQGYESAEEANDFDVGDDLELDSMERNFAVLTKHQVDAIFSDHREVLLSRATTPPPAGQAPSGDGKTVSRPHVEPSGSADDNPAG